VYTVRVLLLSLVGFAALEAAIFRSGFYASILNPESSAGRLETILNNELTRPRDGPGQVLGIGDSRMALVPRLANELRAETGYEFASIAVPGTSPRVWYYMLREVDPRADRYSAVVIGLNSYDDMEVWEERSNRYADTRYLIARLGLSDLWEYAGSFPNAHRWEAARSVLLKGSAFSADFQDFLLRPAFRLRFAEDSRRNSRQWIDQYVAPSTTMEGVWVDWTARTLTVPPDRTAAQKRAYEITLLDPRPPESGRESAYLHRWLGRIYGHYRGSRTRLVFLRLPRGPVVRPDLPPRNEGSSVRRLASRPEVALLDEHLFDSLERPELFQDELHLNHPGLTRFSPTLAREIRKLLGPSR
jgi:hypothetical protein